MTNGEAFIRALENTRGQPLHDYLIEAVTALSTDRAKWVLDMEESPIFQPSQGE